MPTIQERIAEFAAKRAQIADQKSALVNKAVVDEGRTLDEHERAQNEEFEAQLKAIDETVTTLKRHEEALISKATPVVGATGGVGGVDVGPAGPILVSRNLPKGTAFTRYAMALAMSKGNLLQAEKIAETRWKDTPEVNYVLRAATTEGTTTDATWAGPLVQYQDMVSEFIELLRAATILGRLTGVRRVPFNVRMHRQTAGTTGTFVGEGSPTPVKELALDSVTLQWARASTIVVISQELARVSSPAAEGIVRADLLAGIAEYLDKRLVDPAYAGVANVSPASLTYGVTPRQASGTSLAAIDADVKYVQDQMADANLPMGSCVWVMSTSQGNRLGKIRTSQDNKAFPNIGVNGGEFDGFTAYTSNNVAPSGSPGDQHMLFVNQNEVFVADDGQMMLDTSAEASLEFNDAPSGGATSLRSLWQNNLIGLKVDRWINWTKRRSQAVQFIDKAQSYGS